MKRDVDNNPFETAADISQKIKGLFVKEVSRYIFSRRLNDFELKALSPAIKQLISKT